MGNHIAVGAQGTHLFIYILQEHLLLHPLQKQPTLSLLSLMLEKHIIQLELEFRS
jgi:hypothetical protein